MSMFSLAISCLTTSDLGPWFMDLTVQVPMQYCSLQHQTLLLPPDTSTTEHYFCFGPAASFFLELLVIVLCSFSEAYWTPSDLGGLSSSSISFCLIILFMGFSLQEYWRGLPFPPPVHHVFLEPSTLTHPYWVALHIMAHSFVEYENPFTAIRLWSLKGTSHS